MRRRAEFGLRAVGQGGEAPLIETHGKGHTNGFAPVALSGAARGDAGLARIVGRTDDLLKAVWA